MRWNAEREERKMNHNTYLEIEKDPTHFKAESLGSFFALFLSSQGGLMDFGG